MPRRVISIGRQGHHFGFDDDFGGLANGIGSAIASYMGAGQDRAQIEMAQKDKDQAQANLDRSFNAGETHHADDLRLKQEDDQRAAQAEQFRQAQSIAEMGLHNQATGHAQRINDQDLELRKTVANDHRAAALRDDVGAVGKYIGDWMRGGQPTGTPHAPGTVGANSGHTAAARTPDEVVTARHILTAEKATSSDKAWARGILKMPEPPLDEDEQRAAVIQRNVDETGYPDRESNWYNPKDWFRHAPAGGNPHAAIAATAMGQPAPAPGASPEQDAIAATAMGQPFVPQPNSPDPAMRGEVPDFVHMSPQDRPGWMDDETSAAFDRIVREGDPLKIAEASKRIAQAAAQRQMGR